MKYVFDIEADGLDPSVIWCLVLKDTDTGEILSYGPEDIAQGIAQLEKADAIIGHNIIDYDIYAISKLYPFKAPKVIDTLVWSKMTYRNLPSIDAEQVRKGKLKGFVDKNGRSLVGRQSLESWGHRLGLHKGSYDDWSKYTPEMLTYCIGDVEVNYKLYRLLSKSKVPEDVMDLEYKTQDIISRQQRLGWEFDITKAEDLNMDLIARKLELTKELDEVHEGWYTEMKTPQWYSFGDVKGTTKREVVEKVYVKGGLTKSAIMEGIKTGPMKLKHEPFKPSSGAHMARVLMEKHGWVPEVFNEKDGKPKMSQEILEQLPYPEAKLFIEYDVVGDRLEKLSKDKTGYLHVLKGTRIHGGVNTTGTTTYRATHHKPQIGQVPSNDAAYGERFRDLFTVPEGFKLLGTDASGLELRCLAHEMAPYDGGSYAKEVVEGDVHTANMKAFEVEERPLAKTLLYAILYGGGNEKVGRIVTGGYEKRNASVGKKLKQNFLRNLPAYARVIEHYKDYFRRRGHILGLDNRKIECRAEYSLLNFRLQSTGAILCKRWMVFLDEGIKKLGLEKDVGQVGWIHDELQFQVRDDEALINTMKGLCQKAMRQTQEYYDFRCQLDVGVDVGNTWKETH